MSALVRRLLLASFCTVAACRGAAELQPPTQVEPGEESGPLRGWHYVVAIDEALSTAQVEVCFVGRAPDYLIPGTKETAHFATEIRSSTGRKLRRGRQGFDLRELPPQACVEYTVDLKALATRDGGRIAQRVGGSVLARPSAWLWRPDLLPHGAEVTLRFDMQPGHEVSVPWPTVGGTARGPAATYALDATAFRWLSHAVWGQIGVQRIERGGAHIEVVTLDQTIACSDRGLRTWVNDAIDSVALLYGGTFPREHLQVVVVPVDGHGGTIYFGMAARGGGAGVILLLDQDARAADLPGGWTTVHELLHHGMPFVDEAWMAEGFVSYYTELMRTRMGHRDEAEGWAKLAEGFARGERGGRGITLQSTSANMHETFAYQRVYWGGAAIAFLTDVALREDSGGEVSLDDAMAELRRCCGDAAKRWPADDLLAHLDGWYGKPLFSRVAAENLARITFPPVADAFASLGVEIGHDGSARLDESHAGAKIRRSIMAARPSATAL